MSLKLKLNELIKSRAGQVVSINEIYELCKQEKYKYSNADRRLRHSESPDVVPVKNPQGAIIGYRYKQSQAVSDFMEKYPSKPKEPAIPIGAMF